MITPHILLHQGLEPGENRTLQARLSPGDYRLRTESVGVEAFQAIDAGSPSGQLYVEADVETITARLDSAAPPDSDSRLTLHLSNKADISRRIYLEQADWVTDAVTAAEVTSLQHFRELFSDEVLRPEEEIGIEGVTVLFSDLVGSTAMYNQVGDAPSYALVRDQFAFLQQVVRAKRGAIVKTIGDAIMAVFVDPVNGVQAALAIQEEIDTFNRAHPQHPLVIKLGLHHGPCIAVNLNGQLDYFGTTINMAARLEGQSRGGDIVISDSLRQDPAVAELLETGPIDITPFETSIKGFDEAFRLYRLTLRPPLTNPKPQPAAVSA